GFRQLGTLPFIGIERLAQPITALLFCNHCSSGTLQQRTLLITSLAELLLASLVDGIRLAARATHLFEQLIKIARLVGCRLLARVGGTGPDKRRDQGAVDDLFHCARSGAGTGSLMRS